MRSVMKVSKARVLALFSTVFAVSLVLAPAAAQARQAPWSAVPSPEATVGNDTFAAVASVAADDVWAVGTGQDGNGNNHSLIEHWDGTAWSVVAGPDVLEGNLLGITAVSATNVWAVGSFFSARNGEQALIEHWNGATWHKVNGPVTGTATVLSAVTAVSRDDVWAVGDFLSGGTTAQTLIEHFDGNAWSVVSSPDAGTGNNLLTGVAAVSGTDVWAVGHFIDDGGVFRTLTENWNGAAWNIVASPNKAGVQNTLNSVAAASGKYIWAVGEAGSNTLIEQWNGTSWVVVPSPTPAGSSFNLLNGVAIVNGSDVWAVGQSQNGTTGVSSTLIEQWNGLKWSNVPSSAPGSAPALTGVAADPASGQAWAVGQFTGASGAEQTLTEFNP
jgi:hypothetical protein